MPSQLIHFGLGPPLLVQISLVPISLLFLFKMFCCFLCQLWFDGDNLVEDDFEVDVDLRKGVDVMMRIDDNGDVIRFEVLMLSWGVDVDVDVVYLWIPWLVRSWVLMNLDELVEFENPCIWVGLFCWYSASWCCFTSLSSREVFLFQIPYALVLLNSVFILWACDPAALDIVPYFMFLFQ